MGYYSTGDVTANMTLRYDNTNSSMSGQQSVFSANAGTEYRVGRKVSLNANGGYATGGENKGWNGSIGARITF